MQRMSISEHPPTKDNDEILVTFLNDDNVLQNVTIKNAGIRAKLDAVKTGEKASQDQFKADMDTSLGAHNARLTDLASARTTHNAEAFAVAEAIIATAVAESVARATIAEAPTTSVAG